MCIDLRGSCLNLVLSLGFSDLLDSWSCILLAVADLGSSCLRSLLIYCFPNVQEMDRRLGVHLIYLRVRFEAKLDLSVLAYSGLSDLILPSRPEIKAQH